MTDTTPSTMPPRIWAFEDEPGGVPRSGIWIDEQSECPKGSPEYVLLSSASKTVRDLETALHTVDRLLALTTRQAAELAAAQARAAELDANARTWLVQERQRWWQPEYPGETKPVLRVWFRGEPELGLSGFDTKADRDDFHNGGNGPFMRRVTGNEYPQMPFAALSNLKGTTE